MKTKSITIIGNIASGKSTLTAVLARYLKCKKIEADNLFQTTNPFRQRYLTDIKRWAFVNELWLVSERVKILRKYFKKTDGKEKWAVVDSGLLMSWAYAYSHFAAKNLTVEEWRLFEEVFNGLAKDLLKKTTVVRLKCEAESLKYRMKQRNRAYEVKFYNKRYLNQVEKGIEELVKKLKKDKLKVINIRESQVKNLHKGKDNQVRLAELILEKI